MTEILYHYTNANGLIGILTRKTFWLSDYRSLNDRSEITYAYRVIKEVIDNLGSKPDQRLELLGGAASVLSGEEYQKVLNDRPTDPVVIGSFSATNDNPVLWRLYSGGSGFVIGFEKSALLRARAGLQNSHCNSVIYNKDRQIEFVRERLEKFNSEIDLGSDLDSLYIEHSLRRVSFFFWCHEVAPFVKSSAFEHECEWRISAHIRECRGLQFRSRGDDIVPYTEMNLMNSMEDDAKPKLTWLKSIDMGPRVDVARVMPQIYALLEAARINPRKVDFFHNKFPI